MARTEKIVCIGYNKTGTSTFAACCRALGFKHVTTRGDLLPYWQAGKFSKIFKVMDAYQSFDDWPWPLMFREIYKHYGARAKFILTRRISSEAWIESLKAHALTTHPSRHCRKAAMGYDFPHGLEAEHILLYERHNWAVRNFFRDEGAQDQLLELCWEKGDGWPELCGFIGVPVPAAPLPRENSRSDRLEAVDPAVRADNEARIRAQLERLGRAD